MFHKPRWLVPGGRFHEVWLLAHGRNIDYEESTRIDLRDVCLDFEKAVTSESGAPNQRVSLRMLSQLCSGIVKLHSLKTDNLLDDVCNINQEQQKRNKIKPIEVPVDIIANVRHPQLLSEHSSNPRSEYSERSESKSIESNIDSDLESILSLSGQNPNIYDKHSKSLPIQVTVSEGTEFSFSSQTLQAPANIVASERPTTPTTAANPIPRAEQLHLRDSDVFKKPNPPIIVIEEVDLGLPQTIQTESGIGLSLDLRTLSSQDDGTEKIAQPNKDQQINLDQELKNYESLQRIRNLERIKYQAGSSNIDSRQSLISSEHPQSTNQKTTKDEASSSEQQSSIFQTNTEIISDLAGPLQIISTHSLLNLMESVDMLLIRNSAHLIDRKTDEECIVTQKNVTEYAEPSIPTCDASLMESVNQQLYIEGSSKIYEVEAGKKTTEETKAPSTRRFSVSEIEYTPEKRKCRSLGTYDCIELGERKSPENIRFSSPILNSRRRKSSQPDYVEVEVTRKQKRFSGSSHEFELLRLSVDSNETILIPRPELGYMETIPEMSREDSSLLLNTGPGYLPRDPAVVPLTFEDLDGLEPIEENTQSASAPQKGKTPQIVPPKPKNTPKLPSLADSKEIFERRRILVRMSHSSPASEQILKMYNRNMITLPCETDRQMLLAPISSTPKQIISTFVPADVSSIAETLGEPGPSNIESCSFREDTDYLSEKESQESLTISSAQKAIESTSPATPLPVTNIIMGRERYWLRSDESKIRQSCPNMVTRSQSLYLRKSNTSINKVNPKMPNISLPILNVVPDKTKSSRQKELKSSRRRVSCPTPKSERLGIPGITKLRTFVGGITSLSPQRLNICPVIRMGKLDNISRLKTRGDTSRKSNVTPNSSVPGPPRRQKTSRSKSSHNRKLTPSNSSKNSEKTGKRSENKSGNSDRRMALILICPENTVTVENSRDIQIVIAPVNQVAKGMKEFQMWDKRNM